ncbi:hypothetical protein [Bacillus sp. 123MFChir2]|uniref:hypothetical protein n=1 Tax=Bacillus sp. 123MFChir2 TaxID=1169144 RepID=UPI0012DFB092|nr:hypothetical protein [Bacillus sp. 123MFChir2]
MEMFIFFLFIFIIIGILSITNFIVFKIAERNKKKRIWSGIIVVLLTPIIFFSTGFVVSFFDPAGWGTAMLMISYSLLFAINGIMIIVIGLFTKRETDI